MNAYTAFTTYSTTNCAANTLVLAQYSAASDITTDCVFNTTACTLFPTINPIVGNGALCLDSFDQLTSKFSVTPFSISFFSDSACAKSFLRTYVIVPGQCIFAGNNFQSFYVQVTGTAGSYEGGLYSDASCTKALDPTTIVPFLNGLLSFNSTTTCTVVGLGGFYYYTGPPIGFLGSTVTTASGVASVTTGTLGGTSVSASTTASKSGAISMGLDFGISAFFAAATVTTHIICLFPRTAATLTQLDTALAHTSLLVDVAATNKTLAAAGLAALYSLLSSVRDAAAKVAETWAAVEQTCQEKRAVVKQMRRAQVGICNQVFPFQTGRIETESFAKPAVRKYLFA
ncbi:hypothetical protein HK100_005733 [Physocladia obscura]|uniref:Uncharacterized protein n=1 Tax=Physocladia obscura TaxID=109957 RepID=A0AAD5XJ76_9FUNG|nr:hypothetical protein HK100_005733 [Physocladia obscura]